MKKFINNLILGAGISGCAAGQLFKKHQKDYLLLEKNPSPGGLTRSIYLGNTVFDYTGHFLHLSYWDSPSQIPFANLNDSEWQRINRTSGIYINEIIIPALFQYNTGYLPEKLLKYCKENYFNRNTTAQPKNIEEYFYFYFGAGISKLFLIPYNEKMISKNLHEISLDSINRFFPKPENELIINGFKGKEIQNKNEYNSEFWYPINDGIGKIATGLAMGLNIKTNTIVNNIDIKNKIVFTNQGEYYYRNLISSVPLKQFCEKAYDNTLNHLSKQFSHNNVISINLLIDGNLKKNFTKYHWLYFPEKKIPFYRMGFYSNILNNSYKFNETAIYVEKAFDHKDSIDSLETITKDIILAVKNLDFFESFKVTHVAVNCINTAYVHFTHNYTEVINKINDILIDKEVHLIGRYGQWDYISMEDSILSGFEAANTIIYKKLKTI